MSKPNKHKQEPVLKIEDAPQFEGYQSQIMKSSIPNQTRVLVSIPMTGLLRTEWVLARFGQVIPTNWSQVDMLQHLNSFTPMGFDVANARNAAVQKCVQDGFEWLLFIDHDVVLPPDCFIRLNEYMRRGEFPVVCGLYYTRSLPSEPLIYRGKGNSFFDEWDHGDKVWVDGIPMGCTLISGKLLRTMYEDSEEYVVGNQVMRRVFETPNKIWFDPQSGNYNAFSGTEDLHWCDRVISEKYLERSGWGEHAKEHPKYPFLCDTAIFCQHIGIDGKQYPGKLTQIEAARKVYTRGQVAIKKRKEIERKKIAQIKKMAKKAS